MGGKIFQIVFYIISRFEIRQWRRRETTSCAQHLQQSEFLKDSGNENFCRYGILLVQDSHCLPRVRACLVSLLCLNSVCVDSLRFHQNIPRVMPPFSHGDRIAIILFPRIMNWHATILVLFQFWNTVERKKDHRSLTNLRTSVEFQSDSHNIEDNHNRSIVYIYRSIQS